jgi:hypothetical protein
MEGGPPIQYHEEHPLLNQQALQYEPGCDGKLFDPPRKFSLLILDQTHIIAEKFEIEEPPPLKPTVAKV